MLLHKLKKLFYVDDAKKQLLNKKSKDVNYNSYNQRIKVFSRDVNPLISHKNKIFVVCTDTK